MVWVLGANKTLELLCKGDPFSFPFIFFSFPLFSLQGCGSMVLVLDISFSLSEFRFCFILFSQTGTSRRGCRKGLQNKAFLLNRVISFSRGGF